MALWRGRVEACRKSGKGRYYRQIFSYVSVNILPDICGCPTLATSLFLSLGWGISNSRHRGPHPRRIFGFVAPRQSRDVPIGST